MPTEVVVTRVTPPEPTPANVPAMFAPTPEGGVDAHTAEVLRFIGVASPPVNPSNPDPNTPPPASPFEVPAVPATPTPATPAATPTPAAEPGTPAPHAPATPPDPATPAPPAAPAAPAAPATPPPPPGSLSRIASAAERLEKAADRLNAPPAPAAPAAPADPAQPELSPEESERELRKAALQELQKRREYSGRNLVGEYEEFTTALGEYQKRWETAHPGEDFDLDDNEHTGWRERNEPDVDAEDLIRTEARIEARREATQIAEQERLRYQQEIVAEQAKVLAQDAPAKVLAQLGAESLEQLKAKDPVLALAVKEAIPGVIGATRVVHELCRPGAKAAPNNPTHQWVLGTVTFYESSLASMPAADTMRDGRRFVRGAEYDRLSPEQKEHAWTLRNETAVVEQLVHSQFRTAIQNRAEDLRSFIGPAAPAPGTPPPAPAAPPPPPPAPPAPVTSAATSPLAPPVAGSPNYFA